MFALYEKPSTRRSAKPALVSVGLHVVLVSAVVVIPLLFATNNLPKLPTMMAFVAAMPADVPPPPPPPPPPAVRERPVEQAADRAPANPAAAPIEAPSSIVAEPSTVQESMATAGGVEGGLVGGVVGGIVGGLSAAPPPPPPPPPQSAPPPQPVRIGGALQAPALVKRVAPVYPDIALVAKVTGVVILEATVNADGTVESVRVLRSVKMLDDAAVEAVKQWKYSPLVLNGTPTPFVLSVTLSFSIKNAS
jgi:protein TonB